MSAASSNVDTASTNLYDGYDGNPWDAVWFYVVVTVVPVSDNRLAPCIVESHG